MAVDKKYLASTVELNTVAIRRLKYIPSVSIAEQTLYTAAKEMREAKMLVTDYRYRRAGKKGLSSS